MAENPLEQFVLLAKTAKGAAAVELIKQALEVEYSSIFNICVFIFPFIEFNVFFNDQNVIIIEDFWLVKPFFFTWQLSLNYQSFFFVISGSRSIRIRRAFGHAKYWGQISFYWFYRDQHILSSTIPEAKTFGWVCAKPPNPQKWKSSA